MNTNVGDEVEGIPFWRVPRIRKAPRLCGDLRDLAWSQAAVYDAFRDSTAYLSHRYDVSFGNPGQFSDPPALAPARVRTRAYLCHDGTALYIGFECEDDDIGSLLRRDRSYSHLVEREDCVLVWIDAQTQHLTPPLSRYVVNAAGQKGEILRGRSQSDYISLMIWDGDAVIGEDRWTAEFRLPFARLGIESESLGVFGLNLGRGYRGDMQTHLLAAPEQDFICGWGMALLEDFVDVPEFEAQARIALNAAGIRRRQVGAALLSEPGSPRYPNPHRDENAMIGMTVWGPDHQPTLSLGRSDSYDRRWYGNELPVVTRSEVVEAAMSGDPAKLDALRARACNRQYGAYPQFPGPKPVGQLIMLLPGGEAAGWKTEVSHDTDGAVDLLCCCERGEMRLHIYVHKGRNLVLIEGTQSGLDGETLGVRLYRHVDAPSVPRLAGYDYDADQAAGRDTGPLPPPEAGCRSEFGYIRQRLGAEATFPDGFETAIVTMLQPLPDVRIEVADNQVGLGTAAASPMEGWLDPGTGQDWAATEYTRINALPGSAATLISRLAGPEFRIMTAVVSTHDGADVLTAGVRLLQEVREMPRGQLQAESRATPVQERVGGYHYKQDLALSSIFSAKFCMQDKAGWHGDFHFNEWGGGSAAMQFYDYFLAGRTAELENYFQMIEENLPAARALAHQAFDCAGAAWGVASFPKRFERLPMTNLDWDYSLECTGLVMQPFWLTYQYTMDTAFLSQRAYPMIREGARFYSDYVTLEDDGLYHIWPCVSSEHIALQPGLNFNRDSNAALAMTRFILRAAIEGAETLEVDDALLPKWKDVLQRLAPYPTEDTPEGPRFVDVAGARLMSEYNIFQPLFAVFYGNDIGLASAPEIIAAARRTLQGLRRLSTTHWHHVYRAMMRLGIHPGGQVTGECLLQSQQGAIFLFPAVPEHYTGSFENLHARGAFVVSATMKDGRVMSVAIRSLAGGVCRLAVDKLAFANGMSAQSIDETCSLVDGRYLEMAMEPGAIHKLDFNKMQ